MEKYQHNLFKIKQIVKNFAHFMIFIVVLSMYYKNYNLYFIKNIVLYITIFIFLNNIIN